MTILSIFVITLLLSAALLFSVQPMFTKMVLPLLGGTPAVWNTSMVFYQAMLLAGYLYAHASIKCLGRKVQPATHIIILLITFLALPILLPEGWTPPPAGTPIGWLLAILLVSVGLPFFVVSSTTPMLQHWFTHTRHPSAKDPYFLYAASNIGSIGALLGYPLVAEPLLTLHEQSWTWTAGYALLALLIIGCAVMVFASKVNGEDETPPEAAYLVGEGPRDVTHARRLWWVLFAFAPSSLLLGVTNYISTDIASVPLLWVVPLAVYLLTFVIVFSRKPLLTHNVMVAAQPFIIIPLAMAFMTGPIFGKWVSFSIHLIAFFVTAMVCHGELVKSRPEAKRLTEFYIWMSVGGILGGAFNALIAPLVFNSIVEYPLVIALACLLRPKLGLSASKARNRLYDIALPLIMLLALVGIQPYFEGSVTSNIGTSDLKASTYGSLAVVLAVGIVCYLFRKRPVRFGLGIGALIMAGTMFWFSSKALVLYQERSFFGVHKVSLALKGKLHVLQHGTTFHGAQVNIEGMRRIPTAYYHREAPIGELLAKLSAREERLRVAAVGLGAGTLATYARPGDEWTYYEIDPTVVRIASAPKLFTYLGDSQGDISVILGDARLRLAEAPDNRYDLIILDAFSSDAIPVHLVTREALKLYRSKLAQGGVLAFHISNKHLELRPVLGGLAEDAGLYAATKNKLFKKGDEQKLLLASEWVLISRKKPDILGIENDPGWVELTGGEGIRLWTDDYSNILTVLR